MEIHSTLILKPNYLIIVTITASTTLDFPPKASESSPFPGVSPTFLEVLLRFKKYDFTSFSQQFAGHLSHEIKKCITTKGMTLQICEIMPNSSKKREATKLH